MEGEATYVCSLSFSQLSVGLGFSSLSGPDAFVDKFRTIDIPTRHVELFNDFENYFVALEKDVQQLDLAIAHFKSLACFHIGIIFNTDVRPENVAW